MCLWGGGGGGGSDELEIAWLAECSSKAFEELNQSGWASRSPPLPFDTLDRWRKLDFALAKALHGILKQSKESLTEDVILKTRECAQSNSILKGRHIVLMMLDYFKTNRTLQEQYKYQDIESLRGWATISCHSSTKKVEGYNDGEGWTGG